MKIRVGETSLQALSGNIVDPQPRNSGRRYGYNEIRGMKHEEASYSARSASRSFSVGLRAQRRINSFRRRFSADPLGNQDKLT